MKILYASLCGEKNCGDFDTNEYLSQINLPTLSFEEAKVCDLEISKTDCCLTLIKMKKNKARGPDYFPAEVYTTVWSELSTRFTRVFVHLQLPWCPIGHFQKLYVLCYGFVCFNYFLLFKCKHFVISHW